ncbi:4-alpha-glucanotransferase [Thiosulfativibrio zosterae]|uniref:4-alpha-glucanotransferase n=1 Tax=Thiosulfativibrio zosterae TaxID=2675053 RepID=A0A6F8PLC1_9GAMM|nr:4-alpha-glucanotransferase [Thiosulfativibrio zosterae]BBP42847.1 4-alpha-glucanotransferase [Thiosulfativibrio zosterae]
MIQGRSAGVLLHPTSLPNEGQLGQLNDQAWLFLDWMEEAGLKIWQMLPLTQPVQGLSPYQSVSAFALNPALLPENWFMKLDEKAFKAYLKKAPHWLEDYALFMTLRVHFEHRSWSEWPKLYKDRDKKTLAAFAKKHELELLFLKKQQFALAHLWQKLKADANKRGIQLFGDMPIFVAYDSADVWANPEQFKLDENGCPTVVAGVPPDYFSETGQRWGNPHYNWEAMEQDGFKWWVQRVAESLEQFDLIRIDHFRGFEACWEVLATEETAMNGHWQKVPGQALLKTLQAKFPNLPLVAEDLGIITPEVVALKNEFNLPGMSILQFGFNGLPDNPHSLQEQVVNSVVYTGTHDNDTTLGWWKAIVDENTRYWIMSKLSKTYGDMPWPLIEAAMKSPAKMMFAPMQDFLGLDNNARMNIPGTADGNWGWQFSWSQVRPEIAPKIKKIVEATGR